MINCEIPKYNNEVMIICPYIIGLYLNTNEHPYSYYAETIIYDNIYKQKFNDGNEIYINNCSLFAGQRDFLYAAVLWRQHTQKKIFNESLLAILYYPNFGYEYFNNKEAAELLITNYYSS